MTIEEISKGLVALAPQLDGEDRMKLGLASKRSFPTITRYLTGEVKDVLAGEKILEEARKIIADKTAQITA